MNRYCKQLSKTLKKKGKEYGNAVDKTASILKILYPMGISPKQYNEAQFIIRILDKMGRIVHGARNENNWGDAAGYCIRGWEAEELRCKNTKDNRCGKTL